MSAPIEGGPHTAEDEHRHREEESLREGSRALGRELLNDTGLTLLFLCGGTLLKHVFCEVQQSTFI